MPKNSVKPEAAEPINKTASSNPGDQNDLTAYTEQTSLGGPIFQMGSYGAMPCRMKLSRNVLEAAGMKPRDQVEVTADSGVIIIKKIGEPTPGLPIKGCSTAKKQMLDALMAESRAFEAEQREAREQRYALPEEPEAEEKAESLNEAQISQEEL